MSVSRTRYTLIQSDAEAQLASFASEVAAGLGTRPRSIPCRFLYDERGSQLFEAICALPEYYLTRAEREILAARAGEIAERFAEPIALVELGSGSASKTRLLIEALLGRHGRLRYVPVDISRSMLEESAAALVARYDALEIRAIASEYHEGLRHVRRETRRPKLVAWLGSNVGNLTREEAARFLAKVRGVLAPPDRVLLGVDLRKDAALLEAAYDDAAGVTARFSLNLLGRINRELGADFDERAFRHRARWRETEGCVEIEIVSLREQRVRIEALDLALHFGAGEPIHIENSFKYSPAEIDALAAAADLRVERRWTDPAGRYALCLFAGR